jgi:hypothetical protein
MTHVDTANGVEVKAKTESHSLHVIRVNCATCALSFSFEFLLENRQSCMRLALFFFSLCRPMLALEVILI